MIDLGKKNILGVLMDAVDYEAAADFVIRAARERRDGIVSALAVHGLMTGVLNGEQKYRLNQFSLLVPDGHPIRWAMNLLYDAGLRDRVYGPNLTLEICSRAEQEGLPIYLYGCTPAILAGIRNHLERKFPRLGIAGVEPSKFRRLSPEEKTDLANRIRSSGASMVFVGIGCPRQEVWAYEFRESLSMPILAVGAAFAFFAGELPQAPKWMQDHGLEWVFRLCAEPGRLWRRYLLLNPAYVLLVMLQALGLSRFPTDGQMPTSELLYG